MLYLVTIQDKTLVGEPDIGLCFIEADSEEDAMTKTGAMDRCIHLAETYNWGRCVPHARKLPEGMWMRASAVIRGAARVRGDDDDTTAETRKRAEELRLKISTLNSHQILHPQEELDLEAMKNELAILERNNEG